MLIDEMDFVGSAERFCGTRRLAPEFSLQQHTDTPFGDNPHTDVPFNDQPHVDHKPLQC